jgi:hypothetical protein
VISNGGGKERGGGKADKGMEKVKGVEVKRFLVVLSTTSNNDNSLRSVGRDQRHR